MKFGQQLRLARLPKWTNGYIAYSSLKRVIKSMKEQMLKEGRLSPSAKQIQMFFDRIKSETKKVDSFLVAKLRQMEVRKKIINERLNELESLVKSTRSAGEISLTQAIHIFETELEDLRNFCELNFEGLSKITKKFDKQCPGGGIVEMSSTIASKFHDSSHLRELLQWCKESRRSLGEGIAPPSDVLSNLLQSSNKHGLKSSSAADPLDLQIVFTRAVERNETDAVRELLQYIKNIDVVDNEGNTAIGIACKHGFSKMAAILLQGGASVSAVCRLDRTPLHLAAIAKCVQCARLLIKANSELDPKDVELHSPLHLAAIGDDGVLADELIKAGAKLNVRDMDGNTPLALAARSGSAAVVSVLLTAGANIDAFNWYSQVPLHFAARQGHLECLGALLVAGAKVETYDVTGRSAIYESSRHGHSDILSLLIDTSRKALIDAQFVCSAPDIEGLTPLHAAAYHGHTECVHILIYAGIDLEPQDQLGWTPRDYALYCGHLSLGDVFPVPPLDSIRAPDLNSNLLMSRKHQAKPLKRSIC